MSIQEIRFVDGAAYERYMGRWSQLVGITFLDWLDTRPSLRWLDVGCGNGAFTELIATMAQPIAMHGIDPSEEQLAFARERPATRQAAFASGDAMALPFPAARFDVTVMPLVLFFVPDPLVGIQEMRRVTRPGGLVTAYAWDMHGGGFPYAVLQREIRALGLTLPSPPSVDASSLGSMRELWETAGLEAIGTREIVVHRTFASFEDYWSTVLGGPSVAPTLAGMSPGEVETLTAALKRCLPMDASGRITCAARAHAIQGRVPSSGAQAP